MRWFQPTLKNAQGGKSQAAPHVPFQGPHLAARSLASFLGGLFRLMDQRTLCIRRVHFYSSKPFLMLCLNSDQCYSTLLFPSLLFSCDVRVKNFLMWMSLQGVKVHFWLHLYKVQNQAKFIYMLLEARRVVTPGRRHVGASGVQEMFCLLIWKWSLWKGSEPTLTIWARFWVDVLLQ